MNLLSGVAAVFALVMLVATATSVLVLPAGAAAQDDEEAKVPSKLDWELQPSHTGLSPDDAELYLRVRIKAPKVVVRGRQPLNLALVFDRSGSMREDSKIGYLRQAAHLVVDNLTRQDYVTMVAYNDQVQLLVPPHPVVNREYLHHRIDELYAQGYTNLSGGLLEGCAQLGKRLEASGLHHAILITDGLANRGLTEPERLVELVQRYYQQGITLTTIGLGTEFNETLLGRMAQAGGGRYAYVAEPDQMPTVFEQEIGALLSVVAQNTKLRIEWPPDIELQRVFGREEPQAAGELEIPLGDLTSGEERVLLIKFATAPGPASKEPLQLRAVLSYDDVAEASRVEAEQTVPIQRLADGEESAADDAGAVLAYARLAEAVDKIALAVTGMDRRLAAEALQIREQEYPRLKEIATASRDQDFVNKAFMFEHYARELEELIERGDLHEHSETRAKLQKELHYRRYLMEHHRHQHHW